MSLYLDTQGEFALPARDYCVPASVSGWYNRLQLSHLAAPCCPACTPGWTPQGQGTYTYRLEARVAWFYAARPALRGFRSSGGPSASVARFPLIVVILPAKGGVLLPVSPAASGCARYNTKRSRGLRLDPDAETNMLRGSFSDFQLSLREDVLYVVTRCPHAAPRRLKIFSRTTGKSASDILARVLRTYFVLC